MKRKTVIIAIALALLVVLSFVGVSLYYLRKGQLVNQVGEAAVHGENTVRYANELIVYTEDIERNEYGYEVLVEKRSGCAVELGDTVALSQGTYVLSGHGTSADFLRKIEIGDTIKVKDGRVAVTRDLEKSYLKRIEIENGRVDSIIEYKREGLYDLDYTAIENADKKIDGAVWKLKMSFWSAQPDLEAIKDKYDSVMRLIDEKYYLTIESRAVEGRGLWHRPNASSFDESTLEGIKAFADRLVELGINTLYVETFWHGMTTYYSEVTRTEHPSMASFDYGEYGSDYTLALISECHKRGIEVHAWVELLKVGISGYYVPEHIKEEWLCADENGDRTEYFLDPANGEVREFLRNVITEMLEKYDFDGISYDYIRYSETGISPILAQDGVTDEEKCESITALVGELSAHIRRISPETVISASPYGYIEQAKSIYKQDILTWIELGYIDVILPMIYTENEELLVSSANEFARYSSSVLNYIGISPLYNGAPLRENQELIEALKMTDICGVSLFASQNYIIKNSDRSAAILSAMSAGSHRGWAVSPTAEASVIVRAWRNEILDRYGRIYSSRMTGAEREAMESFASETLPFLKENCDISSLLEVLAKMREEAEGFADKNVSARLCEQIDYIDNILNAALARKER